LLPPFANVKIGEYIYNMNPPYTGVSWVVKTSQQLLQQLTPDECLNCGQEGAWLCPDCDGQLQLRRPTCLFCHRLSDKGRTCSACRAKHHLTGGIAIWYYQSPLDQVIKRIKYEGISAALPFLTRDIAQFIPKPCDVITSVPTSQRTKSERGFNQSDLIARDVAAATGIPYAEFLIRYDDDTPQAQLSRRDRLTKSFSRFAPVPKRQPPRRVLIIDDVVTTGATLDACAYHLRHMGAKEVWALALARNILR
jgi:ComF family protein